MTMLQHGLVPSTGGYQIERSLRFNSADTANLNRTFSSSGNRKTWTWSGWVKRALIESEGTLFSGSPNASNYSSFSIGRSSGNRYIRFFNVSTSLNLDVITSSVYRDASAWYHIVLAVDTTQATDSNRVKIYVNGVQVTAFGTATYPSQNTDLVINQNCSHTIGKDADVSGGYLDAYLTEVYFIDGSAKTPSDFGETDTDTGVWKPKAYSGSYGTNGFYLKFADNSGTTSTTLGKDSSGNGNNWTPNNFSVTAGAGNDSLVDTPTPYGTDTGAGGSVRGNYCTLNPLNRAANGTMSNGNLEVSDTGSAAADTSTGTISMKSGKYYFEFTRTSANNGSYYGIIREDIFISGQAIGMSAGNFGYNVATDGTRTSNGSSTSSWITAFSANDVCMVAYDADTGKVWFGRNGTWGGSGDPAAGTNAAATVDSFSTYGYLPWLRVIGDAGTETSVVNFGQRPFAYTAPSGFKALCTQNLPTPTIGATATTRAGKYFNTVLYTGTGSSLSVTGVGFQPDFVWIKERAGAADHGLYDAVRGVQKQLESNNTDAETTETTGLTAFGTDGFTVGALAQLNTNTDTYVAWNWKANGAGSSNTSGTITSTVSANTTAGFSIVTWTANGSNSDSVGHGLGVTPKLVIYKLRNTSGPWEVWTTMVDGSNDQLYLHLTSAKQDISAGYGNLTSTTIPNWGNTNGNTMVAYCFSEVAGYSKFGSYTGNGSTDGPFVYTGFRPAFVLMKVTSTTDSWVIVDRTRSPYNVAKLTLFPNLSNAENDGAIEVDMLSNGFKLRTSNSNVNASQTYIYAAFAEVPTKFSLAR